MTCRFAGIGNGSIGSTTGGAHYMSGPKLAVTHAGDYTMEHLILASSTNCWTVKRCWPCVNVIPTPGHVDGHQSVVVECDDGSEVLVGHSHDTAPAWECACPRRIPCQARPQLSLKEPGSGTRDQRHERAEGFPGRRAQPARGHRREARPKSRAPSAQTRTRSPGRAGCRCAGGRPRPLPQRPAHAAGPRRRRARWTMRISTGI